MTSFSGNNSFGYYPQQFFPPPQKGKHVRQNGFQKFNINHGSWMNDRFDQAGTMNRNFAAGGWGNDSFNMAGFANINFADGGNGRDNFNMGGGWFNKNIANGGNGRDTFKVNNNGFMNENFIDGGNGYDTATLEGSRNDYISFTSDDGVTHFRHKENGNMIHLKNVENINFTVPDFPFIDYLKNLGFDLSFLNQMNNSQPYQTNTLTFLS